MSQMTKRALVASLKELMAEKPLDKITVTDLTEHCGVNRMTFTTISKTSTTWWNGPAWRKLPAPLAGQKTYDTWQQGFCRFCKACKRIRFLHQCLSLHQPRVHRAVPV